MAWQLVTEVLHHAPPSVKALERAVLVVIADEARLPSRTASLSRDVLASRAGMPAETVGKVLRRLRDHHPDRRYEARGPEHAQTGRVTTYRVPDFPAPAGCRCEVCKRATALPERQPCASDSPAGATPQMDRQGCRSDRDRGVGTAPPTEYRGTTTEGSAGDAAASAPPAVVESSPWRTTADGRVDARPIVEAWAAAARTLGIPATRDQRGRVGRSARECLDEGADPAALVAAAERAALGGHTNLAVQLAKSHGARGDSARVLDYVARTAAPSDDTPPAPAVAAHRCDGGWLGDDEDGRPRPCPQCRPGLASPAEGATILQLPGTAAG